MKFFITAPFMIVGWRPVASRIQPSIPVTVDLPLVPPMAMRLIAIAVNRTTRSGHVLGPEQRITAYEALQAMTVNGARQYFEEAIKGTITPGKRADLVVLEGDLDPENPPAVVETWVAGRRAWPAG